MRIFTKNHVLTQLILIFVDTSTKIFTKCFVLSFYKYGIIFETF